MYGRIDISELTTTLVQLEEIIEKGLETFYKVGEALKTIKDNRLWAAEYDSFEAYCKGRWGFGRSNAYYLIQTTEIATTLSSLPVTASHVAPLKRLTTEEARNRAWEEANALYGEQLNAKRVDRIARKHVFYEQDHWLAHPLREGLVTVEQAEALNDRLNRLPPYYAIKLQAHKEGWRTDPNVLQKLRDMEFEFNDEVKEIIAAGHLDGIEIPYLSITALLTYERGLVREKIAVRVMAAAEKQTTNVPSKILSGDDMVNILDLKDTQGLFYLFPEGKYTLEQLVKWLQGLDVFMVVAYSGNPMVDFGNGTYIKIGEIGQVKPQSVMEFVRKLAPKPPLN